MNRRPVSSKFQNVDWNRNSIKVEYSSTGLMLSECCRQVVCSEKRISQNSKNSLNQKVFCYELRE